MPRSIRKESGESAWGILELLNRTRMLIPLYAEYAAWKLSDYLSLLWPDRSARAIHELFTKGRIRSGGSPVGLSRRVGDLSEVEVVGDLGAMPAIYLGDQESMEGPGILYEDDRLIALSKPSGLPIIPDREKSLPSVLGWLIRREIEQRALKPPGQYLRYRVVHRIDRLTSGLVIVAKTPEAEREMGAAFEHRKVRKEYWAILRGVVKPACFAVNCPVVPGRKGKMRAKLIEQDGMDGPGSALSEFQVLERFPAHTLVRVRPWTGRTHQIRVHAWAAGYPLAIDPLYGPKENAFLPVPGMSRLTLHALRYELPESWPKVRTFECPLASDFERALVSLRRA